MEVCVKVSSGSVCEGVRRGGAIKGQTGIECENAQSKAGVEARVEM